MSAKHKRPFYVFAAVAAVCCMVLLSGLRSKAADSPAPEHAATPSVTSVVERLPGVSGTSVPAAVPRRQRVVAIESRHGSPAVTKPGGGRHTPRSAPARDARDGSLRPERRVPDAAPATVARVHRHANPPEPVERATHPHQHADNGNHGDGSTYQAKPVVHEAEGARHLRGLGGEHRGRH